MPFLNGIEITRELRKLTPAPAIVICSVESDEEIVDAARQAGALGYVFKTRIAHDVWRLSNVPLAASFCFLPLFDTTILC